MTQNEIDADSQSTWTGDLLERQKYANFLTKTIRQRCDPLSLGGPRRAFTLAIDGEWGAGKSFFVDRWSKDLLSQQLAVVFFDAWKCDTASEPLVALMSEITKQLEPLIDQLPPAARVRESGRAGWKIARQAVRRIAVPVAKIVAATAVKQLTGVAYETFSEGDDSDETEADGDETSVRIGKSIEKISQKIGAQLEKEYEARQHSIAAFRESLERTVSLLDEHKVASIPLVVFVDELDRCRPDFAIKLLEVVKHLFAVPGVCFVVSMNTRQLSESVRAVYGGGFDAPHYLHRFFDLTYRLPEPNHYAYACSMFSGWPFSLRNRACDNFVFAENNRGDVLAYLFSLVSKEFSLDLRAQKRVFETALATGGAIAGDDAVHSLFLFFACALYVRYPSAWDEFWTRSTGDDFFNLWYDKNIRNSKTTTPISDANLRMATDAESPYMYPIIQEYRRIVRLTRDEVSSELKVLTSHPSNSNAKPILRSICYHLGPNGPRYVFSYKRLIELSGQVL